MQEIVFSIITGGVFGSIIGFLKYFFLWRPMLKGESQNPPESARIAGGYFISMLVNVLALLAVYLIRNKLPLDYIWLLIGVAVSLSLWGRLYSLKKLIKS